MFDVWMWFTPHLLVAFLKSPVISVFGFTPNFFCDSVYVCLCVCIYESVTVCVCICACLCVCMYVFLCINMCRCVCECVCVCVCVCALSAHALSSEWSVWMLRCIPAVRGSCVLIPSRFELPAQYKA